MAPVHEVRTCCFHNTKARQTGEKPGRQLPERTPDDARIYAEIFTGRGQIVSAGTVWGENIFAPAGGLTAARCVQLVSGS